MSVKTYHNSWIKRGERNWDRLHSENSYLRKQLEERTAELDHLRADYRKGTKDRHRDWRRSAALRRQRDNYRTMLDRLLEAVEDTAEGDGAPVSSTEWRNILWYLVGTAKSIRQQLEAEGQAPDKSGLGEGASSIPPSPSKTCPECGGEGKRPDPHDEDGRKEWGQKIPCYACNGTGQQEGGERPSERRFSELQSAVEAAGPEDDALSGENVEPVLRNRKRTGSSGSGPVHTASPESVIDPLEAKLSSLEAELTQVRVERDAAEAAEGITNSELSRLRSELEEAKKLAARWEQATKNVETSYRPDLEKAEALAERYAGAIKKHQNATEHWFSSELTPADETLWSVLEETDG